jgi:hypothetical protein
LDKILPQRGEGIHKSDAGGEELDAMRDTRRDSVTIAGDEVDGRVIAEEEENLTFGDVTDLLVGMLVWQIGLGLRAVAEVEDHQHQVVGVGDATFGACANGGNG